MNKGFIDKLVKTNKRSEEWSTPLELFQRLDAKFKFTLDPCATKINAKCKKFFTKEENGLNQCWDGERVFINPPYNRKIGQWIQKAINSDAIVVCLLPCSTDTIWWHELVLKYSSDIEFIKGRLNFNDDKKNRAPFSNCIVVFDNLYRGGERTP